MAIPNRITVSIILLKILYASGHIQKEDSYVDRDDCGALCDVWTRKKDILLIIVGTCHRG